MGKSNSLRDAEDFEADCEHEVLDLEDQVREAMECFMITPCKETAVEVVNLMASFKEMYDLLQVAREATEGAYAGDCDDDDAFSLELV